MYDIRDFGAESGGGVLCTKAIQDAVDRCARDDGGTVFIPAGTWLTGTVYLQSRITVQLEAGSTLLGSKNKQHYGRPRQSPDAADEAFSSWAILAGKDLEHIAIRGRGIINGQGSNFKYKKGPRPKNIYLEGCSDVLIEDLRLRDAGSWMQHYRDCERVTLRGIAVFNHVSYNNDGLNLDSCRDVTISGCMVDSDDDAIVLKSLSTKPCENISISDCVVSSHCNAIKMGTESGGGFQNITISNCVICSPRYSRVIYGRQRGLAGLALEIVDGGTLERVSVANITIKGVSVPIFMRLGNRARLYGNNQAKPKVGRFRDVIVSQVIATDCSAVGCSITGLPGHRIEDVILRDIVLNFEGGGSKEDVSREVPEKAASYPESTMFGTLPAYGFFCRHATGLELHNVKLRTSAPDFRHAIVLDDVEDSVLGSIDASFTPGAAGMIRLTDSREIAIRDCCPPQDTELFLDLSGAQTRGISVYNNNFTGVKQLSRCNSDVPGSALILWSNQLPE